MGITYIEGTVIGPTGKDATLELLVDTGNMYAVLPHRVWQAIELQPERTEGFRLMDGTKIERQMSDCRIRLPQGEGPTFVVLGEPGDEALLGVHTLEGFGLMVNPLTRELVPMRLRQGAAATGEGAA